MLEDLVIEYLAALDAYETMKGELPSFSNVPAMSLVQAKQRLDHALAAMRAAVA